MGKRKRQLSFCFVPCSCVFYWLALLRPSRRHSRVLAWLASQDSSPFASSLARAFSIGSLCFALRGVTRAFSRGLLRKTALLLLRPLLVRFLLARFASPFASSLVRSRVARLARHLKSRAFSQVREAAVLFTGESVHIYCRVNVREENKIFRR